MNETKLSEELQVLCSCLSTESRTLEDFEWQACMITGIRPVDLYSESRKRKIVTARSLCYKYLKQYGTVRLYDNATVKRTHGSVAKIAWRYNAKTHATVLHGLKKLSIFLDAGDKLAIETYNQFKKQVK